MNSGMLYGGDEIGALVFDLGSQSFRIGYAQEDTPKAEIPAMVGISDDGTADTSMLEPGVKQGNRINGNTKYYIDINSLCVPRQGTWNNFSMLYTLDLYLNKYFCIRYGSSKLYERWHD